MMDDVQYQGARFYKCALQLNPASYANKYQGKERADEEYEEEYNEQVIEQCREHKIEVVGLADHGQVESSESLRKYLRENEIVVFPGFEIASSEKIHMVCLYPEDIELRQLNQYLGQLMGTNASQLESESTHPSSKSCQEMAEMVSSEQQGFWYAAHMTGKNGILRLSGTGDNFANLWKKDGLVIAGQIPAGIEDLDVGREDLKKIPKNHRE